MIYFGKGTTVRIKSPGPFYGEVGTIMQGRRWISPTVRVSMMPINASDKLRNCEWGYYGVMVKTRKASVVIPLDKLERV